MCRTEIILLPGGKLIFVEMKKPGRKGTQQTEVCSVSASRLGFDVFSAVDSNDRIDEVVERCKEAVGQ